MFLETARGIEWTLIALVFDKVISYDINNFIEIIVLNLEMLQTDKSSEN